MGLYFPQGICAKRIRVEIENDIIKDVHLAGCCDGQANMLKKICIGTNAKMMADLLLGNECQNRGTSCANELAKCIVKELKSLKENK